jgi:hypothetical protein
VSTSRIECGIPSRREAMAHKTVTATSPKQRTRVSIIRVRNYQMLQSARARTVEGPQWHIKHIGKAKLISGLAFSNPSGKESIVANVNKKSGQAVTLCSASECAFNSFAAVADAFHCLFHCSSFDASFLGGVTDLVLLSSSNEFTVSAAAAFLSRHLHFLSRPCLQSFR